MQAQRIFSRAVVDPNEVEEMLENLTVATTVESVESPSQFPRDLQAMNDITEMTVGHLLQDLTANSDDPFPLCVVSS